MKIWKDEEVKNLFVEVENCKAKNSSLKFAFENHAKTFKRKPNSVRNYYYAEVENLLTDKERTERLGLDLSKHRKNHFVVFSGKESQLLHEIENLTKQGFSVRSACQKLSGGNLSMMTRLQNKFQNEKKKNKIISFKQPQHILSDNEINSLFMGLVKLIRKNVEAQKPDNELLRQAFYDLEKRTKELNFLKQEFIKLKEENKNLSNTIDKMLALKTHLKHKKIDNNNAFER